MGMAAQRHLMPAVHPIDKGPQLRAPLAANSPRQHLARAVQQRHPRPPRRALNIGLRLVAQTALGRVDHPLERQIVLGRYRQPEIGHRVADLLPLIKTRATDHPVRQPDGQKAILERPHLMAGPDQNGDVVQACRPQPARAALQRLDLVTDPARLLLAIPMADQPQLLALGRLGPQRLAQTPGIGGNHP